MALTAEPAPGTGDFEFDIATPLFEQIQTAFDAIDAVDLSEQNLGSVEARAGVYGLLHNGRLVYVGKADANVAGRVSKHRRQISGRLGINIDDVSFKCLYLALTWDPFKPEEYLIQHYDTGELPGWNGKGFGTNDPGRNRDHTDLGDDHWHVRFPLDPDYPCSSVGAGEWPALQLLREIASEAPYWVRFQGNRPGRTGETRRQYEDAQRDYEATRVAVPQPAMSVKNLLLKVVRSLPDPNEWQLTQMPGHLLLYKERDETYPRMKCLWPPRP